MRLNPLKYGCGELVYNDDHERTFRPWPQVYTQRCARAQSSRTCTFLPTRAHTRTHLVHKALSDRAVVDTARAHKQPRIAAELSQGSPAALEAAWRLFERRHALAHFLLAKQQEAEGGGAAAPTKHPKAGGRRPAAPAAPTPEALHRVDSHLLGLAAVLTGLCDATPDSALAESPVARLSGLIGTPRDMSSAAAAQLRKVLLCKLPSLVSRA